MKVLFPFLNVTTYFTGFIIKNVILKCFAPDLTFRPLYVRMVEISSWFLLYKSRMYFRKYQRFDFGVNQLHKKTMIPDSNIQICIL